MSALRDEVRTPGLIHISAVSLREHRIPDCGEDTDKNARGRALIIAGSERSPGAALLAGTAALRAGAGKAVIGTGKRLSIALGLHAPELGLLDLEQTEDGEPAAQQLQRLDASLDASDAVLLGPGLMNESNARKIAVHLLEHARTPVVLDAAAITGFGRDAEALGEHAAPVVLTPHAGELAALTGSSKEDIEAHPLEAATQAAASFHATVILKGATTYVVEEPGRAFRHCFGVPGLATSGSGDVLAGILVGLLARGATTLCASLWSVFLHAAAGAALTQEVGPLGFLAGEIPGRLPRLLAQYAS
jgi:hydroxyethylthiazole kinase-like uncharacterized protein yjeF